MNTNPTPEEMAAKMFPIQSSGYGKKHSIPWHLAEKAYETYKRIGYGSQTLEKLAERGGFGWTEWACYFLGHEPTTKHAEEGVCVGRAIAESIQSAQSQLQQRIEELEKALEFYGNKDNYAQISMAGSPTDVDYGKKARQAINPKKEGE